MPRRPETSSLLPFQNWENLLEKHITESRFVAAVNLVVTAKYLFLLMANVFPPFGAQAGMASTGAVG